VRSVEAAITHKQSKILHDCRQVTGEPSIAQREELGTLLSEKRFEALLAGKPTSHQIAHVAHPPLRHPDSPAIAVANRCGGNSRIFADLDDALQWLGIPQDDG
jgi:hypothetical protein